jgi:hypothetical protein
LSRRILYAAAAEKTDIFRSVELESLAAER